MDGVSIWMADHQEIHIIDKAWGQDGGILAKFSFWVFMDLDENEVHKKAKRERGQHLAILTELAWSIKDLLYGILRLHVALCSQLFFAKCILETHQHFCFHSRWRFWLSRFLVPPRLRNHRKTFYCHGKYFAKEKFRAPDWTSAKFNCGEKNGQSRARSIAPSYPFG